VSDIYKCPLKFIREEVQSSVVDLILNDINCIRRSINILPSYICLPYFTPDVVDNMSRTTGTCPIR